MNITSRWLLMVAPLMLVVGCTGGGSEKHPTAGAATQGSNPTSAAEEAEIQANLAKLDAADRKLAEAQRFCAVESDNRLGGEMGTPVKIMVKGEPVFLCCGSCKKTALADPEKTLTRVKELKAKAAQTAVK